MVQGLLRIPLMAHLRMLTLPFDYQYYQSQKIKVISKAGHPAY